MIKRIVKYNQQGMVIPISFVYQRSEYDNVSQKEALEYINCYSKESFSWVFENIQIILNDEFVSIKAYPSICQNYIVAIYQGKDGAFPQPNNAVIYNLNGSIHKVLEIPKLISPRLLEQIEKNNESNPPLEAVKYDNDLGFLSFGWDKDKEGILFNYISIQYHRDYGEGRELNVERGEIGRLIEDWYNYY